MLASHFRNPDVSEPFPGTNRAVDKLANVPNSPTDTLSITIPHKIRTTAISSAGRASDPRSRRQIEASGDVTVEVPDGTSLTRGGTLGDWTPAPTTTGVGGPCVTAGIVATVPTTALLGTNWLVGRGLGSDDALHEESTAGSIQIRPVACGPSHGRYKRPGATMGCSPVRSAAFAKRQARPAHEWIVKIAPCLLIAIRPTIRDPALTW
jgi:hypothetical protein